MTKRVSAATQHHHHHGSSSSCRHPSSGSCAGQKTTTRYDAPCRHATPRPGVRSLTGARARGRRAARRGRAAPAPRPLLARVRSLVGDRRQNNAQTAQPPASTAAAAHHHQSSQRTRRGGERAANEQRRRRASGGWSRSDERRLFPPAGNKPLNYNSRAAPPLRKPRQSKNPWLPVGAASAKT